MRSGVLEYDDLFDCFLPVVVYSSQVCWKEADKTRTAFISALLPRLSPFSTKYYAVQLGKMHVHLFAATKVGDDHQRN